MLKEKTKHYEPAERWSPKKTEVFCQDLTVLPRYGGEARNAGTSEGFSDPKNCPRY